MPINLTVVGQTFAYPSEETDTFWGSAATGWAQAVTAGMLSKSGGSFGLLADVNFGSSFGLKSKYFTSITSNPSSAGVIRLANTDTFGFRNAANSADLLFSINPLNNHLLFDGVDLSASSSSGNVVGPVSATDNALCRFDSTTGQLIQNSSAILSDAGALSGLTDVTLSGALSFGSIGATAANLVGSAMNSTGANAVRNSTTVSSGTSVSKGNLAVSTPCGTFSVTSVSAGYVDVTNLSVTIDVTGNPVDLYLVPSDITDGYVGLNGETSSSGTHELRGYLKIVRITGGVPTDRTVTTIKLYDSVWASGETRVIDYPCSAIRFLDNPPAGTHTYKLQIAIGTTGSFATKGLSVVLCSLVAKELI